MTLIPFSRFKQILREDEGYLRSYLSANGRIFKGDQGTSHWDLETLAQKKLNRVDKELDDKKYGFIDHEGNYRDQRDKSTWRYARDHHLINLKAWKAWGRPRALLSDVLKPKHISNNSYERKRLNPKDYLDVR